MNLSEARKQVIEKNGAAPMNLAAQWPRGYKKLNQGSMRRKPKSFMKSLEWRADVCGCIRIKTEHDINTRTGVDRTAVYNILLYLRRGKPYIFPTYDLVFKVKWMVMPRQRSKSEMEGRRIEKKRMAYCNHKYKGWNIWYS